MTDRIKRRSSQPDIAGQLANVESRLESILESLHRQRSEIERVGEALDALPPASRPPVANPPRPSEPPRKVSGWRLAVSLSDDDRVRLVRAAHRAVSSRLKAAGALGQTPLITEVEAELRAAGAEMPRAVIATLAARAGLVVRE